jgi:predicted transglutaminase-like cysteine proteinase
VRQALIAAGIPADRLRVSVRDTTVAGEGQVVRVGKE